MINSNRTCRSNHLPKASDCGKRSDCDSSYHPCTDISWGEIADVAADVLEQPEAAVGIETLLLPETSLHTGTVSDTGNRGCSIAWSSAGPDIRQFTETVALSFLSLQEGRYPGKGTTVPVPAYIYTSHMHFVTTSPISPALGGSSGSVEYGLHRRPVLGAE